MSTLTTVTFEPDRIGIYIDGELHERGESYMEPRILKEIMVTDINISETWELHYHFEQWKGMPSTLTEAEQMYGDE